MRRWHRAVWIAALVSASAAWARWQQGSLGTSTPTDVNVMDAGVAVVASEQGLHAVYMGLNESPMRFGASIVDAGAMVGGRTGPGDCVFGMRQSNSVLLGTTAACGNPDVFLNGRGRLFVTLSNGSAVAAYDDEFSTTSELQFHGDAGYAGPWEAVQYTLPPGAHLASGAVIAGSPWIVATRKGFPSARLIRPGIVGFVVITNLQGQSTAVSTFQLGANPAVVFAVFDGGLKIQSDLTASQVVGPVTSSPIGDVQALAVTELGGDQYGRGFGFAGGDGGVLWGPVPNPQAVAQVWVPRTEPGAAIPQMVAARCIDASKCVVLGAQTGNASLNWYYNTRSPELGDGGTLRLAADAGASFQVTLPVYDPDGDPVWVTWEPDGGALQFNGGVAGALFNEKADFTVPGTVVCGTTSYPFSFRAADGWAPNTRQFTGFVDVTRNEPPGLPTLGNSGVTLYAGGPDVFVTYAPPSTGCAATDAEAASSGTGFTVVAVDGGYLFTPNATFCSLDGGSAGALTVTNTNDAGSSVATVGVSLVPWGAPGVGPFSPGPSVQLDAGSGVDLFVGGTHVCQNANGFPGFELLYTHDAGSTVTVTPIDGGFHVQSLDVCVASQFTLTARTQVAGEDAGRVSPTFASVNVAVIPNYPRLDGGEFTATFNFDPVTATAYGDLSLTAACQPQRNFDAVVTLFGTSGAALDDAGVWAVPGPWDAGVVGGCNGITFTARAELRENGAPTGIRREQTFMPPRVAAGVGPFTRDREPVSCNQPLRFSVTAQPDAGACAAQAYYWKQLPGGPQVQFSSTEGQTVELTSSEPFDALGGAVVTIEVSSDAGMGNVGPPRAHDITLVPAPFIELSHDFEPLPAREGEAVPVRATLLNTSGCDVSTLVLEEDLGALKFVDGSARLNGAAVEGRRTENNTARVGPIAVAAGQKATVTWLARAPLRSTPRLTGTVYMGNERVSVEATPPQRCSCGSAPMLSWAALLGLLRLFRRKRS
jgi:hypothetical protein